MQQMLNLLLKRHKKLPWPVQLSLAKAVTLGAQFRFARLFSEVKTYATFVGHSRSGHSLIAALLDAHPNIVMAHELRAVKYLQSGFRRDALYYLLLQNARIRGHSWERRGGYTYDVPGQWQGSFERIRVIGDKHGSITNAKLASDPKLLSKLQQTVDVPVKLIHVVRNPFDNIATIALRKKQQDSSLDLRNTADAYFKNCESLMKVKEMSGENMLFNIRHEDFVFTPVTKLHELCTWLGVEPSSDYLSACSKVVFASPNKSRHKVEWEPSLKSEVQRRAHDVPFLEGYAFDR